MRPSQISSESLLEKSFSMAATDISAGYAADSFVQGLDVTDPWAEDSFVNLFDALVNHEVVLFPHPTKVSTLRPERLPALFTEFQRVRDGAAPLLKAHAQVVAEDYRPSNALLHVALYEFLLYAIGNRNKVDQWISFQESLRGRHIVGVPEEVQPHTVRFWDGLTSKDIPPYVGIPGQRLRYAFDVFFRGLLYCELLSQSNAVYYPHRVRMPLVVASRSASAERRIKWSWGGIVAALIQRGRL